MEKYIIKELYATVDSQGIYIDTSDNEQECRRWQQEDVQAKGVIKGYGIFNIETGFIDNEASDFYYTYEEAKQDLEHLR